MLPIFFGISIRLAKLRPHGDVDCSQIWMQRPWLINGLKNMWKHVSELLGLMDVKWIGNDQKSGREQ